MAPWVWCLALTQIPALPTLLGFLPNPALTLVPWLAGVATFLWLLLNPPRPLRPMLYHVLGTPWPSALVIVLYVGVGGFNILPGIAMAFALWALRHSQTRWPTLNTLMLLWASCGAVWVPSAFSAPLISFGFALLGVVSMLTKPRLPFMALIVLAWAVGGLAALHVSFLWLPLLVGFALLAVWPKRALWVGGVGVLTAAFWHGGWWALNTPAPFALPLPISPELLNGSTAVGAAGVIAIAVAAMLYHWRWWPPMVHIALGLGTPLAVLAMAELATHSQVLAWQGGALFMLVLPLSLMSVLSLWPLSFHSSGLPKFSSISDTKNQKMPTKQLAKRRRSR